jgi:hypothetical protein
MKREQTGTPQLLFYSYAHEDELLREQLEKHLSLLKRQGFISGWHDREILPGATWAQEIDVHLESASIVLLLISPDFLASDYCYEVEMQRALERHRHGETRVIPIIMRPCDWQDAPFAHLQCLPRNGQPVTMWSNQDEAFLNIIQGLRKVIERGRIPTHPLPTVQQENRARLIKQMRAIWIDGLLEHALQQTTWLDLGLQEHPDALDNPWDMLVQELDAGPRPLPAGTTVVQVYDEAEGRLLILGEPGMGKTTLLLQLTRTLLNRAEHDLLHPLPVVFVLSSWAQKRQPLAVWLVEELKARYQIPRAVAQHWISEQQVLPLLDGLDEVASGARAACVQAINVYMQDYLDQKHVPLVVSCRSREYADLSTHVALQKAVSILPLSPAQIEQYLQRGGKRVEAIQQALHDDTTLAEMARTPLLLSIFVLAYLDVPLADLPLGRSLPEILPILFATYVKRMLRRRGLLKSGSAKQTLERLTFLAKQMHHYNQTVFSVETLQVDGLSKWQERLYNIMFPFMVGLIFFLVVGPLPGLVMGLASWRDHVVANSPVPLAMELNNQLSTGLSIGVIVGFFAMLCSLLNFSVPDAKSSNSSPGANKQSWGIRPKEALILDWSWKNIHFGLLWGLGTGLFVGLIALPYIGVAWLAVFLLFAMAMTFLRTATGHQLWQRIRLRLNKITQNRSWKNKRFDLLICVLAVGFLLILVIMPDYFFRVSLPIVLMVGVPVWVIVSALKIASGSQLLQREHLYPNEGIRRSGINGLVLGLIVTGGLALPLGLASWLSIQRLTSITVIALPLALIIGLALGLFFGLSAFLRHFVLRFWLWLMDLLPWNIVAFLDEMVERIFLRRIGGSYIFIHRFLLDYFASLTPVMQLELAGVAKTGPAPQARRFRRSSLQPGRIFNKRWSAVLVVLAILFLISSFIASRVQESERTALAGEATSTAQSQKSEKFYASMQYPSIFPEHGQIFLFSSLQPRDIMSLADDPVEGCYARKDGYHISQSKLHTASFCGYNTILSDVAIQVKMSILRGDCSGIAFRSDPHTGNGYFFYVCQKGIYGLRRDDSSARTINLIPATTVSGSLLHTNTLAVVALGSKITLFINGQQIAQLQDKHYIQGVFSFAAYAMQSPTEVLYSDMRVWTIRP